MNDNSPIRTQGQEASSPPDDVRPTGLALMRVPFPASHISKLPKPTKRQTEEVRADFKKGIRCKLCGQWHHPDVVHLDYVGHAALTDRLLECDPAWNWEPVATNQDGTPMTDANGGMWIRLTICNVTRLGYGHPDGKKGGDAIKELIGDALRNAAMRFGAALDLWHKGNLHADDVAEIADPERDEMQALRKAIDDAKRAIAKESTVKSLAGLWGSFDPAVKSDPSVIKAKDARKAELAPPASSVLGDDEIPY